MPAETGARSPNCWWTRSSSLRILTKIDKAGRRYYTIRAIDKQFTPARLRPGYKVEQIDAFLDEAEQRLAAMRSDVVRRALKSPSLLGYARRGLSSGCTYWISSADLDVGEVRFLCTLVTAPQDQRGTDEPGHHQVKDREVDIPGPGENEDGQPGEVPDRCRPPDPAGYEFRHRQGAADGCLADEGARVT